MKEVVVGSALGYSSHDIELSFRLFFYDVAHASFYYPSLKKRDLGDEDQQRHELNRRYVDELVEDIEDLAQVLAGAGVTVYRPESLPSSCTFATPDWQSTMIPALNVRDQTIIFGDEILETSCQVRSRLFENDLLKRIYSKYSCAGSRWTSMPRPRLLKESFDTSYVSGQGTPAIENVGHDVPGDKANYEIMLDGAQCLRFGRDVLVNVSTENHAMGARWLRHHLKDRFRIHIMHRFADNHIDSLVLPLRPGLLLVRNREVAARLPGPLQRWEKIYAPEPSQNNFPDYSDDELIISSPYIDMNVLSLNENTVVANSLFPELITELERNRFTVIPVRHRHRRLFGGGFHCFTLDTVREGKCEDYFGNEWNSYDREVETKF